MVSDDAVHGLTVRLGLRFSFVCISTPKLTSQLGEKRRNVQFEFRLLSDLHRQSVGFDALECRRIIQAALIED